MAPVITDRKKIRSFRTQAAFDAWMKANHDAPPGRAKKIATLVAMLARRETIMPQRRPRVERPLKA